jgi:LPS export ABC transporter protein LptC
MASARHKSLKYIFLITSVCILMGVTYTVYSNDEEERAKDVVSHSLAPLAETQAKSNNALNPHFQAVDEKGQPYTIKADSAIVRDKDDIVVLSSPSYTIRLTTKTQITVTALQGYLDQDKKKLTLDGRVVVHYGDGTTFTMPNVRIDLKAGDAFGDQSIQGISETMHIRAGTFDIQNKGDKIILTDKPVLTFTIKTPSKEKSPS